ncbi:hypothetical protein MKW94_000600 [Papaver nudicaule]|uniref:Uncharacterized protein n=1 Tax=Papaver nudicaule TaxID=74823 RepID=A0AA41RPC7_PAPNU|nr:hypothetical protein [Papaver nudicaule]
MDLTGPIHDFLLVFFGNGSYSRRSRSIINVLIIFAVMFMNDSEYYNDFSLWTVGNRVTSLVCTSIFVSLITTIPDTSKPDFGARFDK